MNKLAKALSIAAQASELVLDKGGQPYFLHCLRVMNDCGSKDEDVQCAAVLHDFAEDARCPKSHSFAYLRESGIGDRALEILDLLTHEKHRLGYDDYVKRLSHDKDAVSIKMADLRDNSNITRLKGLRKKDFDRLEKYHRAYTYLEGII